MFSRPFHFHPNIYITSCTFNFLRILPWDISAGMQVTVICIYIFFSIKWENLRNLPPKATAKKAPYENEKYFCGTKIHEILFFYLYSTAVKKKHHLFFACWCMNSYLINRKERKCGWNWSKIQGEYQHSCQPLNSHGREKWWRILRKFHMQLA